MAKLAVLSGLAASGLVVASCSSSGGTLTASEQSTSPPTTSSLSTTYSGEWISKRGDHYAVSLEILDSYKLTNPDSDVGSACLQANLPASDTTYVRVELELDANFSGRDREGPSASLEYENEARYVIGPSSTFASEAYPYLLVGTNDCVPTPIARYVASADGGWPNQTIVKAGQKQSGTYVIAVPPSAKRLPIILNVSILGTGTDGVADSGTAKVSLLNATAGKRSLNFEVDQ